MAKVHDPGIAVLPTPSLAELEAENAALKRDVVRLACALAVATRPAPKRPARAVSYLTLVPDLS